MKIFLFKRMAAVLGVLLLVTPVWAETGLNGDAEVVSQFKLEAGYQGVGQEAVANRAAEYTLLEAGPVFGLTSFVGLGKKHVQLDGRYLNEQDYNGELHLDHGGRFQLNVRSEALSHNLDHFSAKDNAPSGSPPGTATVRYDDLDPSDRYQVQVRINEALLQIKPRIIASHLKLRYWSLERKGQKQMRFLDESCTQCHIRSKTRQLDRKIEEFSGGLDAHLGPIDIIFEQTYRQFKDREPIPEDAFADHSLRNDPGSNPDRYQHDEDPDSRQVESSLKLHTSLAGGVVGAASVVVGKRQNRSNLADVSPVESETDYFKAAGDVTYLISPAWTLNFRYRLLNLDNSNPAVINATGLVLFGADHNPLPVRDTMDLTTATYQADLSYRPSRKVSVKGEYKREDIHRSNTGPAVALQAFVNPISIDPVWELPENETIDRFRINFFTRPLNNAGLKLDGWYQYLTSSDPAYATSIENGHTGFLAVTLSPSPTWGLNANVQGAHEENFQHGIDLKNAAGVFQKYQLNRSENRLATSTSAWLNAGRSLFLSAYLGWQQDKREEDLLFGSQYSNVAANNYAILAQDAEANQQVQTGVVSMTWRMTEHLKPRIELRHIRSSYRFDPEFADATLGFQGVPTVVDSTGLGDISSFEVRQNGLTAGVDWLVNQAWTCTAKYDRDDYNARDDDEFDGTAQTVMVSFARSW